MNENTKRIQLIIRKVGWIIIDFVLLMGAYCAIFFARTVADPLLDLSLSLPFILAATLSMLVALYISGVYQHLWSHTSGHDVTVILRPVVVMTIVFVCLDFLTRPRVLPLSVLLFGAVLAFSGMIAVRYRSRLIHTAEPGSLLRIFRKLPDDSSRVLIIGAGESGQDIARRLKHRFPIRNYNIVGFIDDDPHKQQMYIEGCRVLGGRNEIEIMASKYNVDLIVIAVHNITGADFREIVSISERTNARIKVIPDVFELVRTEHSDAPLRDIQPEDLLGRSVVSRHEDVDLSTVSHKSILITGAAGSIGSELSRQILDYSPTKVMLLDNNESGLHDLQIELRARFPDIPLVPALVDIASIEAVRTVFKQFQPQIVFHTAAYKHVPMLEYYPQEALRVNINGTLNLAEMAVSYDVERFVLVSTDKAVKPSSIMGASKRIGELLMHALSIEKETSTRFVAVRFGNVLGSRGSVIPTFSRQIDHGGPLTVTHPDMTRYFMSIPEAVNLIIHAASMTEGDEIYVLKMGEVVKIVDLARRMIRLRGMRPDKDIQIAFTGMRPGEKMHEELYYPEENPSDTIHPNIVKLNNWPQAFKTEPFYNAVMRLITQNQNLPADAVMDRLQQIIAPHDHRAADSDKRTENSRSN